MINFLHWENLLKNALKPFSFSLHILKAYACILKPQIKECLYGCNRITVLDSRGLYNTVNQ